MSKTKEATIEPPTIQVSTAILSLRGTLTQLELQRLGCTQGLPAAYILCDERHIGPGQCVVLEKVRQALSVMTSAVFFEVRDTLVIGVFLSQFYKS